VLSVSFSLMSRGPKARYDERQIHHQHVDEETIAIISHQPQPNRLDLDDGRGDHLRDGARVLTELEVHEPVDTPARAPAVPDDPVRRVGVEVVPDGVDAVVDRRGALVGGEDAARVGRPLRSVDANGERALGRQVRGHLVLVLALSDVLPVGHLGDDLTGVELALLVLSDVGVVGQRVHATGADDVLVGVVGPAAAAAVVGGVAVDDLLHGELGQRVAGEGPARLDVLGGRESPVLL
jgi:hypothetical protein